MKKNNIIIYAFIFNLICITNSNAMGKRDLMSPPSARGGCAGSSRGSMYTTKTPTTRGANLGSISETSNTIATRVCEKISSAERVRLDVKIPQIADVTSISVFSAAVEAKISGVRNIANTYENFLKGKPDSNLKIRDVQVFDTRTCDEFLSIIQYFRSATLADTHTLRATGSFHHDDGTISTDRETTIWDFDNTEYPDTYHSSVTLRGHQKNSVRASVPIAEDYYQFFKASFQKLKNRNLFQHTFTHTDAPSKVGFINIHTEEETEGRENFAIVYEVSNFTSLSTPQEQALHYKDATVPEVSQQNAQEKIASFSASIKKSEQDKSILEELANHVRKAKKSYLCKLLVDEKNESSFNSSFENFYGLSVHAVFSNAVVSVSFLTIDNLEKYYPRAQYTYPALNQLENLTNTENPS